MQRLLLCFILIFLAGCSSQLPVQQKNRQLLSAGSYDLALAGLEQSSLAKSSTNELLYLMEKGSVLYLAGDYDGAITVLNDAERLADDLFTKSVSRGAASFLSNDNVIPYAGEDYETALIHYYKALAFLQKGELEAAAVECRKVDERLLFFFDSYGGKNVYKEDAFLRFLTGLIYEADGDVNNAFIAYRKSLEAYRYYAEKYGIGIPDLLWGRLLATAKMLRFDEEFADFLQQAKEAGVEPELYDRFVVVLAGAGTIPMKVEESAVFNADQGIPVKLALPVFAPSGPISSVAVTIDGTSVFSRRVQNIDAIARQSLEDKKGRIVAKMVARVAAKLIAAKAVEEKYGAFAGIAARAAALASEQADLRLWSSLPAVIDMAIVPVESGDHSVEIAYGGRVVTRNVQLANDRIGFVPVRFF